MRARAKVNLRLEVLGLRRDGYHEVYTVLHTLDLADAVRVRLSCPPAGPAPDREAAAIPAPGAAIGVTCRPDLGLPEPDNLAYRAAAALLEAWRAAGGVLPAGSRLEVEIDKSIPAAAGLGGGSADAAATLRGGAALLARVAGDVPVNLQAIARGIGSDVPFLLQGGAAVGLGRGEELLPWADGLECPLLLLVPDLTVRARDAYGWWDQDGAARRPLPGRPPGPGEALALDSGWIGNELRPAVARRFPMVEELRRGLLAHGALAAEMTGSGPVVFGVFGRQAQAEQARADMVRSHRGIQALLTRLDPAAEGLPAVEEEGS